jgi:hypothetical protein
MQTLVRGGYLPKSFVHQGVDDTVLEFGAGAIPIQVSMPVMTPASIRALIEQLRSAREKHLSRLPVAEIVRVIVRAAALWRDRGYPHRQEAERLLPAISGVSPEMIRETLDSIMGVLSADSLTALLESELGDPEYLDGFRPRRSLQGLCQAFGPRLVTHVFSGNVAGLPALSLIYALLVKSASLGKVPSEEPLFSSLFARSLAEVSPEIGECLAIVYWKGGNRDLQGVAFDGSDWVIGYGSDATIQDLATQVRLPTRALWYGHKLSFAVVGRERLTADTQDETARRVATDVSFLDQQGCLSPHVIFVESEGPAACVFAEAVAREMESFNRRVPRGVISPAESVAIHRIRATYEFREMENEEVRMFASAQGTDWTVILDPESTFQASCLNRTIRICPVRDLSEIEALVTPIQPYLQTVGYALDRDRTLLLAERLGRRGVVRFCPLGSMTYPPVHWHHDGRFNLVDLLQWTDVDVDHVGR